MKCECGKVKSVSIYTLRSGHSKSCGHDRMKKLSLSQTTHGKTNSRVYTIYRSMMSRCYKKRNQGYSRYGARGIGVCPEWFMSFEKFYTDMGDPPTGMQLDRIDNDKGYSKENCRWTTASDNMRNRRNTRFLTVDGVTKCVIAHCEDYGLRYNTWYNRVARLGWDEVIAIKTPGRKLIPS